MHVFSTKEETEKESNAISNTKEVQFEQSLKTKENRRQIRQRARQVRKNHKMEEWRIKKEKKQEHRREYKKIKENHHKEKEEISNIAQRLRWYNFFTKWFFTGVIFILFSLCLTLVQTSMITFATPGFKILNGFMEILIGLLSSVGIALLVGSIFDFSKNSEAFTSFVSNIIKKIIVTKEFLCEIKSEEKRKVLEMLIAPTDTQIEQCSSINLYYKKSIDDFFNLYNQPFKTNLTINIFAKFEDEKVICEGNVSSRRYKTNGVFQPIFTSFEKENSEMKNVYILLPNGEKHLLEEKKPLPKNKAKTQKMGKQYMNEIPKEMNIHPYITVGKDIKEIGSEEYILFNWSSLTPCDGVSFELNCSEDLEIVVYKVFDDHNLYEVNINEERDNIRIVSNSWLDKYTGFTILIKKK